MLRIAKKHLTGDDNAPYTYIPTQTTQENPVTIEQANSKFVRDGIEGLHYFVSMYVQSAEELLAWMDLDPEEQEAAERALYDLYGASQTVRRMMEVLDQ